MPLDTSPADVRSTLLAQIAPELRAAMDAIVRRAEGVVYAAGGAVRDALLGRSVRDIDLVTEADAITVVREALPGARITAHSRFRTVTLKFAGARLDVATARTETYPSPGALPRVSMPATIEQDLRRRDFSVNAIALRLNGEAAIVDPCDGVGDLHAGAIRILHDASFRDDPTRVYRAFRYAARLGFTIEPRTRDQLPAGVRAVEAVSGERLRREIEWLLLDEPAGKALEACNSAGALASIDSALHWDGARTRALADAALRGLAGQGGDALMAVGFALLTSGASQGEAARASARLRLRRAEAAAVNGLAALAGASHLMARPGAKPSGVLMLLDRFPAPAVAAFAGLHRGEIAGHLALRYLGEWRHVKPSLSGADLQKLGVPAGPHVQRGLQLLRAARLDGVAPDAVAEHELALRFVRSIRESEATTASPDVRTNGH